MNLATMKYNKIVSSSDGYKGFVYTVHKDIVALLTTKKRPSATIKSAATKRKHNDYNDSSRSKKCSSPDFITHYKDSSGTKYKAGDKKLSTIKSFISVMHRLIVRRLSGTLTRQMTVGFARN